jgi:hypothetical protein
MPTGPGHYFGRLGAGRLYGQKFLIAFLMELSKLWFPKHARHPFGIGDIAAEDGSSLPDHTSHTTGAAVDLFIIHKGGVKRNDKTNVITYEHEDYDREKTIDLAAIIAQKAKQYRLIQFLYNDPDAQNTVQCVPPIKTFAGHDEHIHLLFNGIHPHTDEELDRILGIKSFSERLQEYLQTLLSSVHMLLYGSNGPPVQALQAILNTHGSSNFPLLAEDGIFGSKTKARVQEFQVKSGLTGDGVVGPKTKQALSDSVAKMQAKR